MIIDVLSNASASFLQAKTRAELSTALQSVITSLGFDSFKLSAGKSDKREFVKDPTVTSWNDDDVARYDEERWAERDPLLAYASSHGPARAWKVSDWRTGQDSEFAYYMESFGLKGGVTVPLTKAPGSLASLTVMSAKKDAFDDHIVRALPLLGNIALMKIEALGLARSDHSVPKSALAPLSDHQMEILRWAAQGKSNADISEIIGATKRNVEYNMRRIIKTLDVSTKLQAAAIYSINMD